MSGTLAAKLREARRRSGLKQAELATRSGVGAKSISAFERGHPRMKVTQLLAILAACGVDPSDFFSESFVVSWDLQEEGR